MSARRKNRIQRPPLRLQTLEARLAPSTYTVSNANNTGSGSLRQAVLDANAAPGEDLIDFSSFFNVPRTITLASEIAITGPVTIAGPSAANVTVSGNNAVRIFNTQVAPAGTIIGLVDLTLTAGRTSEFGGAVGGGDEALGFTRCRFTENTAGSHGGAVALTGNGSLTATDCAFTSNYATYVAGGAVYGFGGAVSVRGTSATTVLTRCEVSANTSHKGGGVSTSGSLLLEASTVSGNVALGLNANYYYYFGSGGGIHAAGPATIRNSTISGNSAGGGGGIYPYASLLVQNSTVAGNSATYTAGGGISSSYGVTVVLESSIVANNYSVAFGPDIRALAVNSGTSSVPDRSGILTFTDLGGNRPAGEDPRLGPLQDNGGPTRTRLLLPGSPCVNTGSNPAGLATDQRGPGFPRVLGGAADMGAAEGVDISPTATATGVPATVTAAGGTSYTVTVRYDDDVGIDLATLDLNDVTVTGPGYAVPQVPTALAIAGSGAVVTAIYTFPAPGGAFDFADDGFYTIAMAANQVRDLDAPVNHSVAAGPLGSFTVAVPGTLVVDEPSDIDDGDMSAGHLSLREVVRLTNAAEGTADTITFSPAVFGTPRTITLTAELLIVRDALAIVGPGAGLLTLNSAGPNQILYIFMSSPGAAASVSGLTVTNALGGGIASNAGLTLTGVVVTDCMGTGVFVTGPLTLRDSVVSNNRLIDGATPYGAGGIYVAGSAIVIERSSVVGNESATNGGGLFVYSSGTLQISDSTIADNRSSTQSSGAGGGICLFGVAAPGSFIRNSTISGNVAANGLPGGGLSLYFNGTLAFANSTITGNSTTGQGGGIALFAGYYNPTGTITLNSTIIAGNSAGSGPDFSTDSIDVIPITGNNNLVGVANAGNVTLMGTGNVTGTLAAPLNPMLGPLADNGGPTRTHSLLAGSPAINAGSNAAGLSYDQRGVGFARNANGSADIGSFEVQTVAPPTATIQINDGAAQRSRVASLAVTFSTQVTFAGAVASAFTLTRNGGGSVAFTATSSIVGGVTVVTLNAFSGSLTEFGSLRDGRYTLTVLASQVSANGQQMAGNATFGDAQGLFRFFGDVNGDRRIDISDFGQFSVTYNRTSADPAFNAIFDFNNDGRIDIADFGQFSVRFFTTLP